ncbi:MAG TPA: HD domain-containing phosphohydrolase [Fimbriiglobus sp.]|jgi:HD-GYP domain-containing protein (c-di-GMP phosphodiesterase class II)
MTETRGLLQRIAAFRERLENTPLLKAAGEPTTVAENADRFALSLRTLTEPESTSPVAQPKLTHKAVSLLQDARELVAKERAFAGEPTLADADDPLTRFHRKTVALTEAALRQAQAFPGAADDQIRVCDGIDAMLCVVRDRLAVLDRTLAARKADAARIERLTKLYTDLTAGRVVSVASFAEIADTVLEDSRRAVPVRFLAEPGPIDAAGAARFAAAHAVTAAQIAARIVGQDFEWGSRPLVPVVACLLTELGLAKVPAEVLATAGPLDAEARRLVERHPRDGAELIRTYLPDAGPLAEAVLAHHERPDGTGYPNGTQGDAIPALARFLTVCDVYTGMACDRPHRPAHDPRTALTDTLLDADRGRLDRDFAEYLLALSFHPVGTVVELTDGRVGVVVANHTGKQSLRATTRPVVAVLADEKGTVLPRPDHVDLAAADRGGVVRILPAADRRKLFADWYPEVCG